MVDAWRGTIVAEQQVSTDEHGRVAIPLPDFTGDLLLRFLPPPQPCAPIPTDPTQGCGCGSARGQAASPCVPQALTLLIWSLFLILIPFLIPFLFRRRSS